MRVRVKVQNVQKNPKKYKKPTVNANKQKAKEWNTEIDQLIDVLEKGPIEFT